jgi:hypothetical protein
MCESVIGGVGLGILWLLVVAVHGEVFGLVVLEVGDFMGVPISGDLPRPSPIIWEQKSEEDIVSVSSFSAKDLV